MSSICVFSLPEQRQSFMDTDPISLVIEHIEHTAGNIVNVNTEEYLFQFHTNFSSSFSMCVRLDKQASLGNAVVTIYMQKFSL